MILLATLNKKKEIGYWVVNFSLLNISWRFKNTEMYLKERGFSLDLNVLLCDVLYTNGLIGALEDKSPPRLLRSLSLKYVISDLALLDSITIYLHATMFGTQMHLQNLDLEHWCCAAEFKTLSELSRLHVFQQ